MKEENVYRVNTYQYSNPTLKFYQECKSKANTSLRK
jgi:hypothetical protein